MERDKFGYVLLNLGSRKFYITPYVDLFSVRHNTGEIVRISGGVLLLFASEDKAVAYMKNHYEDA